MKTFTINFFQKQDELGKLLENYCKRIDKLSSSNHDLDSLFSLLFNKEVGKGNVNLLSLLHFMKEAKYVFAVISK